MPPLPLQIGIPGGMELAVLVLFGLLAAPFVLIWWLVRYLRRDDEE